MARRLRTRLELGPQAPAFARRSLASLARDVPAERLDDLRLMVSELVTNSFRHAGLTADDSATLTIDVAPGRVHVQVEDPGKGFTIPSGPRRARDRATGWGLTIIERLAERWGVIEDGSTIVWFDLDLRAPRRAAG